MDYPGSFMSETAIKADENSGLKLFELSKIYSDHEFNCRMDKVVPTDVIDLAKSIADKGLLSPIILRPCGEKDGDPDNFDYVIVAGHRRFQAYRLNNHPVIPAMVRQNESQETYKSLNLVENIKRKQLNLLEEAKAIEDFYNSGRSREWIAKELGVSMGWVQVRCMILELEPEVQNELAAGILTTSHVRKLYSIKDREQQLSVALRIKEARQRGDVSTSTVDSIIDKDKKPKATTKKRRSVHEIEKMMEHLHQIFGMYGLTGRALAWSAGHIANYEFYQDIKDEAREQGISYDIPDLDV